MDSYDLDVYAEFVPTLYSTTSRSQYYKWEDAIINCYMIGELTLDQLANLAKQSFSPNVKLWLWSLRQKHGDDYCTSWYEMKEVLRRRFAPPLELEKNILSSSEISYMVASEFASATQFEKNASTNQPAIMGLPSDLPAATSIVEADVLVNASVSDFSFTSGLHSGASSHDSQSDINIDDIDDSSDGLSMMARYVHSDGTAVMVKRQQSNIIQSECQIHDKVCKMIIDGGSYINAISSDLVHALSLST